MQQKLRIFADIAGVAVFLASGWGSVHTWLTKDEAMTLGLSIPVGLMPGIYAGLAGGALVLLAHLSVPRFRAWKNRKADRFRELAPLLEPYAFGKRNDVPGIRELHFALAELGIDYPVEGVDPKVRRLVSADLWAASRNHNIKHARTSWARRGEISSDDTGEANHEPTPDA